MNAAFRVLAAVACFLALSAAAQVSDADRQRCQDFGLAPDTAGYAQCLRERDVEALQRQCWGAMAGRSTSNGQPDLVSAARCRDDPVAHLRPPKTQLNCTPTRTVFGRVDGVTCQ